MGSLEEMQAIDNASQQASEAQKKAQEAAEKAQQAKENLAKLQQQQKNSGVFHGLSFHQLVDHNYGNYQKMLDDTIMKILVHAVVFINSYFLLKGEKYYNENVGAE